MGTNSAILFISLKSKLSRPTISPSTPALIRWRAFFELTLPPYITLLRHLDFTFSTISVDAKIGYEYLDETSNYHKNASSYATDYGHKTYIDSIYGMLALNFQENFFADIGTSGHGHLSA